MGSIRSTRIRRPARTSRRPSPSSTASAAGAGSVGHFIIHCEERADEAIHVLRTNLGLLRELVIRSATSTGAVGSKWRYACPPGDIAARGALSCAAAPSGARRHHPEKRRMEPLPKGANFVRAKTLWEIGLHLAGNPATPYGGNRDMVITVGSGAGAAFRPWLRLATGSAILAEQVAAGNGIDLAFVNPSALLTQAYRGVGLFRAPLPLRIVAAYPSWDGFVFAVHPRTGLRSLADLKA